MRAATPINENLARKYAHFYFNRVYSKGVRKSYFGLFIGILGLILGIYMEVYPGGTFKFNSHIVMAIGFYYFLASVTFLYQVRKNKRLFNTSIEENIQRIKKSNLPIITEVTDDYFIYEDEGYCTKIKWSVFTSYQFIEDGLFIELNIGHNSGYFLSKEELGDDFYTKALQIIKEKIKPKSNGPVNKKKQN